MIPFTYPSKVVDGETACVVKQITPGPTDEAWKHYIPIKESYRLNKTNTYDTNGSVAASGLGDITGKTSWIDYIPVASVATSNPWRTDADGHIPLSFVEGGLSATQINAPASSVRDAMNTLGSIDFQPHNVIRNSAATGAVAGTPGTLPTNWGVSGFSGLTRTIVGTGTINNLPYIDIRYSGTASGAFGDIYFDTTSGVVAANGQQWIQSAWVQIVAGSSANVTNIGLALQQYNAALAALGSTTNGAMSAVIDSNLKRVSRLHTTNNASTAYVRPYIGIAITNGGAVDITLRIAAPQLERGSAPRNFVSTSGTAVAPFYGYLLPGAAGARLNTSARTSLAMQQRADGVWEFAPHNLVDYSEQTHLWTAGGSAVSTPNAALSPNNQLTASKLAVGLSTFPQLTNIETQPVNLAYTASGYFKAAGVNFVQLRLRDSTNTTNFFRALMDLNTGEVGNIIASGAGSVFSAYSEYAGNGWWRLVVSGIPHVGSASTTLQPAIILQTSLGGTVATPSNSLATDGIFIWGMQINRGSFATSYVPTTTTAAYAPAIDWLPTQRVYGLRSEEARTNSIRNNTMVGAVVGSPGTFPTNWGSGTANGITASVVQLGTDSTTGMPFIEVRYTGTATANNIAPSFEPNLIVAASDGQAWSWSTWMAFVGSGRPSSTTLRINARNAGGSLGQIDTVVSPTTSMSRFSISGTLAFPTVTHITPFIRFGLVISQEYDFTVRYVAPQLELGAFATSPILTYGATATRAADTLVVPNNAWIGQTAASIAVDYVNYTTATGSLISTDDGSTNNRVITFTNGGTTPAVRVVVGGVDQANMNQASVTAGTLGRLAFGVAQDNFAASINGAAVTTDTSGTVPSGQTTMRIGTNVLGAASLNGHITSFRYDNVRLLDQNLIDLTTG